MNSQATGFLWSETDHLYFKYSSLFPAFESKFRTRMSPKLLFKVDCDINHKQTMQENKVNLKGHNLNLADNILNNVQWM